VIVAAPLVWVFAQPPLIRATRALAKLHL